MEQLGSNWWRYETWVLRGHVDLITSYIGGIMKERTLPWWPICSTERRRQATTTKTTTTAALATTTTRTKNHRIAIIIPACFRVNILYLTISVMSSGGFRGGGGTPGPCPPFWNLFLHLPPPLFVHVPPPPFLKPKKKKKCVGTQKCVGFPPPPPPVWDLRDFRRWWRSEKKVLELDAFLHFRLQCSLDNVDEKK